MSQIADMMVDSGIGRIPVVDPATSRLVGILSRQDLLKVRHVHRASEWKRR
ncbi:CBS domain-containing protein [Novosphingobium guangzhouense]|uniref:CBS domain-containing protein n=1 Tax=Novosphingobium guangzhouense TaxID=1850347 RepID=UPI002481A916|nr:CBS domain-containing protein [Novosphingobium guangzhouense]